MKTFLSSAFLTITLFIIVISSFYIKTFAFKVLENQDSTKNENSIWEIQIGYFHDYTNSLTSDGLTLLLLNESIFVKEINHGYYFTFLKAFNNRLNTNSLSGSFSLGVYINYPLSINDNYVIIRTGVGIGYPTVTLNFLNMVMIEYTIQTNNNIALSFSLLQEIANFHFFSLYR